ncbi:hypothetical protein MY04_05765 (plasmid) [Flammeovirga sp. MY04]|uniref:hypothetical protein n=1 Tax=Flammeovirga sp. MY04 TaxID=1191459 RepID=UPI00080618D0|nr:hypothetical protein [Flammeovirga sp. MY04]ANQ52885.1 hypothetical protein MY04_05765 [Flammeovirga sp. MY04]
MKKLVIFSLLSGIFLSFYSCKKKDENIKPKKESKVENTNEESSSTIKTKYVLSEKAYFPESFDYDEKNNQFILGSLNKGEIGKLNPVNGEYTVLAKNDDFVNITGIYTDEKNNRIIAAISDIGVGEKSSINTVASLGKLGFFDSKTGDLIKLLDLRKSVSVDNGIFLNDITMDKKGNIYVTNSFGNSEIFKVNDNYKVSVLDVMKDLNANLSGELGVTGITYHQSTNSLIVGHSALGNLYAVPLSSLKPYLLADNIESVDGIELLKDDELYITQNAVGKIKSFKLSVENKIIQAKVKDSKSVGFTSYPTAVTSYKGQKIYALYSNLISLFMKKDGTENFTIVEYSSI